MSAALNPIGRARTAVDVEALQRLLDGEHAAVRETVRDLLGSLHRPDTTDRDAYRDLVLEWTRLLAAEGVGRLGLPAPYGTGDVGEFIAAFSEIAHFDLSLLTKAGVQFGLFAGAIDRLGTGRHHSQYLAAAASLELPGCFAMTETGHGSNVRDLETTATYDADDDSIVIHTPHDLASKDYIGNAARHGRMAVVFARLIVDDTDHGVHAILVPIRDEAGDPQSGIRIEDDGDKEGLNGVDNARIWFDSVRVPRANLLDRFGSIDAEGRYRSVIDDPDRRFFAQIRTLIGGRIAIGSAAVSVAKTALTIAVRYANRRRQFGPEDQEEWTLIDYPLHQSRLMPRLAATYAFHFAFEELVAEFAKGDGGRRLETAAGALKAFATWHAVDTVQAAREATGGQGYLAVNRLGSLRADSDVFTTYEGDNTVLVQLVAKSLLGDLRRRVRRPIAAAAYLLRRGTRRVVERLPFTSARGPTRRLDAARIGRLLAEREDHLLDGLARRLQHRMGARRDPFTAFAEVQQHAFAAARAHTEGRVYRTALRAAGRDDRLRPVLTDLAMLFGASRIEADLGWFLEHRVIAPSGSASTQRLVARLSERLSRDSMALVDAFGIPDGVLGAPIALLEVTSHDPQ